MKTPFFILTFLIAGCSTSTIPENGTPSMPAAGISLTESQLKANHIETGMITRHSVSEIINCVGEVGLPPNHKAKIHARIPGLVKSVLVIPGQKIAKGEVLATLEHNGIVELQKNFIQSENNLTFLKKEHQRKSKLAQDQAVSQKAMDEAEMNLKNEESNNAALRAKLRFVGLTPESIKSGNIASYVSILSPFSGYVSKVFVNLGEFINADQKMFELVDKSHIHLEMKVYAPDAARIPTGAVCYYRQAGMKEYHKGWVKLVGKDADPTSRMVEVHAHPSETDTSLIVGMAVNANIALNQDSVLAVPSSELIRKGEDRFLFQYRQNRFAQIKVTTGKSDQNFTEITGPDSIFKYPVVLNGNYYLLRAATE